MDKTHAGEEMKSVKGKRHVLCAKWKRKRPEEASKTKGDGVW
jgi:hypothetical protein